MLSLDIEEFVSINSTHSFIPRKHFLETSLSHLFTGFSPSLVYTWLFTCSHIAVIKLLDDKRADNDMFASGKLSTTAELNLCSQQ